MVLNSVPLCGVTRLVVRYFCVFTKNIMRQLAAILFADMAGYTAFMQENEQLGMQKRRRLKEVLAIDKAFYHLEKCIEKRTIPVVFFLEYPAFEAIRHHPHYPEIRRRSGL